MAMTANEAIEHLNKHDRNYGHANPNGLKMIKISTPEIEIDIEKAIEEDKNNWLHDFLK